MMSLIEPGTIGLVRGTDTVSRMIAAAQWLNGAGSRFACYTHALISVGNLYHTNGDDGKPNGPTDPDDTWIVEARPSGAVCVWLPHATLSRHAVTWWLPSTDDLGVTYAETAAVAFDHVGTKYSFADYAAIAAHRSGLGYLAHRIDDYVSSSGHMICSQLVDYCYQLSGYQLFNDGRLPGSVTPADLARLACEHGVEV